MRAAQTLKFGKSSGQNNSGPNTSPPLSHPAAMGPPWERLQAMIGGIFNPPGRAVAPTSDDGEGRIDQRSDVSATSSAPPPRHALSRRPLGRPKSGPKGDANDARDGMRGGAAKKTWGRPGGGWGEG